MRLRRIPNLVAVVAVLAVSCGGDSNAARTTTSTSRPTTTTTQPRPVFQTLDELVDYRFPGGIGAVIVGVFEKSSSTVVGIGEDGDGRPVDGYRPWQTASLGKVFTAVAVLELVERGLIDLEAPVADYVDFPMSDQITIRHVLQHRSNIPDMMPVECPDQTTVDQIEELAGTPSEPSDTNSYANTNYTLLGLVIGSVTGEDPGIYMRDNVFTPAGMKSTYWYESQEGPSPWWRSPESTQGVALYDCGDLGPTIGTDGAAVTTATDMDSFYRALFGGTLLDESTLAVMLEMDGELFDDGYGLGIGEITNDDFPDDRLYGFGGFAGFYGTMAFHDPAKSRTVALFTTAGKQDTLLWQAVEWANQQAN